MKKNEINFNLCAFIEHKPFDIEIWLKASITSRPRSVHFISSFILQILTYIRLPAMQCSIIIWNRFKFNGISCTYIHECSECIYCESEGEHETLFYDVLPFGSIEEDYYTTHLYFDHDCPTFQSFFAQVHANEGNCSHHMISLYRNVSQCNYIDFNVHPPEPYAVRWPAGFHCVRDSKNNFKWNGISEQCIFASLSIQFSQVFLYYFRIHIFLSLFSLSQEIIGKKQQSYIVFLIIAASANTEPSHFPEKILLMSQQ